MGTTIGTYQVEFDSGASARMNFGAWDLWLRYAWILGLCAVFLQIVVNKVVSAVTGFGFNSTGDLLSMALAIGVTMVCVMVYFVVAVIKSRTKSTDIGQRWTCQITDVGWSFQDKNGILTFIPWTLMKVKIEHPEGWLVNYGGQQLWVFRKPLQDAGLEDEFWSRVGKSSAG